MALCADPNARFTIDLFELLQQKLAAEQKSGSGVTSAEQSAHAARIAALRRQVNEHAKKPPKFVVRPMTGADFLAMQRAREDCKCSDDGARNIAGVREVAFRCIVGWENVTDGTGAPLPLSTEAIDSLPLSVISEVGSVLIAKYGGVTGDEEKN